MDSIKRNAKYFFEAEKWTDCSFLVGNTQITKIIKAHKIILAMGSSVFEGMLLGDMAEKKFPIVISDTLPEYFVAMLKYIYTNDLSFIISEDTSFEQACGLYYLADKYLLPSTVLAVCADHLEKNVNFNNACSIYEFSNLHSIANVKQKAIEIIRSQTKSVLLSSSFRESHFSTVMYILQQEKLQISSEVDLCNAITRYFLYREINRRDDEEKDKLDEKIKSNTTNGHLTSDEETLEEQSFSETTEKILKLNDEDANNLQLAVKMIRFLTMSPNEFADGPAQAQIMYQNDINQIMFAISNLPKISRSYPKDFSTCMEKREHCALPRVTNLSNLPDAASIFSVNTNKWSERLMNEQR